MLKNTLNDWHVVQSQSCKEILSAPFCSLAGGNVNKP